MSSAIERAKSGTGAVPRPLQVSPEARRRRPLNWLAVAIALVSAALLVVVGAIVLLGRRAEPQAHDVAAAPPEETAAAPPSVQLEPIATAPPEPAPQASAEPEPEPSATAPKPEPKQPSIAKPVVAAPPQQKNCNPPYTIENGIKKFKRECL